MNVHDEYKEYIRGKRVIFVGACPNLLKTGFGEIIDKYDVVVRSNGSFEIQNKYKKDYGSRTDVLYCNVQYAREMRPLPVKRYAKCGIKFLCGKTFGTQDLEMYSHHVKVRSIKHIIKRVHKQVHGALMGLFLIEDILECKPKELFLTGIDFFKSKRQQFVPNDYREYLDGYLPQRIIDQGNIINMGKMEDGHNQYENTLHIYRLWKKNLVKMNLFIEQIMIDIVERR